MTAMDENDDDLIDRSQWVQWSDSDPLVKPERAAKGDIRIEYYENSDIKFAQVQIRNILNFLWESGVIDDEENDAGHCFEAWRNQHRVALGLQRAISGEETLTLGTKLRAYGYVLLVRRLSRYEFNAVNQAVDTVSTSHTREFACRSRGIYRTAFKRLSEVILPIRERVSYLEGLSEAEREALSEDNLKNLIAEIIKCC